MNNNNMPWEEWYEALCSYADKSGTYLDEDGNMGTWSRKEIEDCGVECWKEYWEDDLTPEEAFYEGFSY